MHSLKIYGIWPQASKQASKNVRMYVNTLPQCSPASVGLAQARPNKQECMVDYGIQRLMVQDEQEKKKLAAASNQTQGPCIELPVHWPSTPC